MPVYCIDTETTGLHPEDGDEIVQLSIVNAESSDVILDEYFRPSERWMRDGWGDASIITGITPDTVASCRSLKDDDVRSEVEAILHDADTIIAYNTPYDVGMLSISAGIDMSGLLYQDAMRAFALYYGSTHPDDVYVSRSGHQYLDGGWMPKYEKYAGRNLTFAAGFFGVSDFGAHNSLNDVYATIDVWYNMLELDEKLEASDMITNENGEYCYLWKDERTETEHPLMMPNGEPVERFVETYTFEQLMSLG